VQADSAASAFVALCRQELPSDTVVLAGPPEAGEQPAQAVWVESDESEFEFFALGRHAPKETLLLNVVVQVQRDGAATAQAAARDRAAELEHLIAEQVLGETFDLGGTVVAARVSKAVRTYVGTAGGWTRRIALRVSATTYP
jgi:hypothetical protein